MGLKKLLSDLSNTPDGFRQKTIGYHSHLDGETIYDDSPQPFIEFGFDGNHNIVSLSNPNLSKASPTNMNRVTAKADELDALAGDLIRGGTSLQLIRRYTDYERIDSFLRTSKGQHWLTQQVALQLSNPRVDAPMKGAFDNLLGGGFGIGIGGNVPDPNQTEYNPLLNVGNKTLLSVGLSGLVNSGQMAAREGLIPFVHFGYYNNFFDKKGAPKNKGMGNINNNRLVHLSDHIGHVSIVTEGGGLLGNVGDKTNDLAAKVNKGLMWLGGGGEELFSYLGGPDSLYGIGTTIHRRWYNTTRDVPRDEDWKSPSTISEYQSLSSRKEEIVDSKTTPPLPNLQKNATGTGIQNYLKAIGHPGNWYDKKIDKESSRTYHRESNFGLGTPGRESSGINSLKHNLGDENLSITSKKSRKDGQLDYSVVTDTRVDKINALGVINDVDKDNWGSEKLKDIIPFRFEAVSSSNPSTSNLIVFRAFLDTFADNFNANYNEFNYNGRAESFYTYGGFKRSINLTFKIAAQSRSEMQPLYQKLNYLVSNTAGDYHPTSGRIRTPFIKLTVGNYLNRTPGVLNSIGITWQKNYPWEIALDSNGRDKDMLILPHVLDVAVQFTPVHNFLPQKSLTKSPFILPSTEDINLEKGQKWIENGKYSKITPQEEAITGGESMPEGMS